MPRPARKTGILIAELRSGSRRGKLPAVRVKIVQGLVEDYGVPNAEVARQVGISTSGVSKIQPQLVQLVTASRLSPDQPEDRPWIPAMPKFSERDTSSQCQGLMLSLEVADDLFYGCLIV